MKKSPTRTGTIDRLAVFEVVAGRLRQARIAKGWTQQRLGQELGPYLEYTLTQAGVCAIELSHPSRRYRCIDVAELVAFARCLDRSVLWFLSEVDNVVLGTALDNASDTQLFDELQRRLSTAHTSTRRDGGTRAVPSCADA